MTALHLDVAAAGTAWLAIGIVVYVVYRRRQGLDLTTTTRVATPKPVIDHEAEYESVLVAFDEREYVPDVLATAIRLAARRSRGIHVIVTITVPATSPIDAALPEQELAAQSLIEQAKVQGGRRVTGHWEKVRAGQAGRRIVDEAREIQARAIVMPLPSRAGGGVDLRPHAGDGARRAPVPRDHRVGSPAPPPRRDPARPPEPRAPGA